MQISETLESDVNFQFFVIRSKALRVSIKIPHALSQEIMPCLVHFFLRFLRFSGKWFYIIFPFLFPQEMWDEDEIMSRATSKLKAFFIRLWDFIAYVNTF